MVKKFYILFLIVGFTSILFGQEKNTQLGTPNIGFRDYNTGYYDYSDPSSINIKVAVWGYLKYPGKYLIPQYSSVNDLISYAGGPEGDANMDDLRVYRILSNGKEEMIKFTYNDLISYAGGPEGDANMDDLRVYRILSNGKEEMIKFTYNDLMYDSKLEVHNRVVPKLRAGDILIVPGAPRLYFRDYFSIVLSIFSALTSLVILIFTIVK